MPIRLVESRIFRVIAGGNSRRIASRATIVAGVLGVLASAVLAVWPASPAVAATGINHQINFQGKVVANPNGTNVANGSYSFTFKLYSQQAPGGTATWTETKTLTVTDGIFVTALGDTTALPGSVDFNSDNIFFGISFNSDPEMTPRIQFTAAPYAFNSEKLGGLTAAQFAQLSPASVQSGSLNVTGSVQAATSVQAPLLDTATAVALGIGTGTASSVTIGRTTTPFLIQGNSTSTITATNGSFTTTVGFATPTANNTITFPNAGGTVCTTTATTCSATYQAAGSYLAKNASDTSAVAVTTSNYLYGFTNSSSAVASGVLKLDNGTNTGNGLLVTAAGNPGAGNALIVANNTNGTPSGNLIDLQVAGASKFAVTAAGNLTTAGTITSGLVNGQTISSAASFTGTVTAASTLTVTAGGLAVTAGGATINGDSLFKPTTDTTSSFNVKTSANNNVFTVDTLNSRVGIGLGGSTVPTLTGTGLEVKGALRLSGGSVQADTFTTPGGASIKTAINIPFYDPGNFSQILAFGLPGGGSTSARALTVVDGRTGAQSVHQPSIAVLSPNEAQILGFSWDGSNTLATVKTSSGDLALQANGLNVITAENNGGVARLGVGQGAPAYPLDVTGDVNTTTQYRIGGTVICTSTGCTPAAGSTNYIQNTISQQASSNFNISGTGVSATALQAPVFQTTDVATATTNSAALALRSGNSTTSGNTGNVTVASGNAASGNSGNVSIDAGTASGTKGSVTIGGTNAAGVAVGKSTGATTVAGAAATSSVAFSNGANATTITATAPTANRSVIFGDEGGTVCLQGSTNCSFAAASGSANYIQNGTAAQTANFNIRSAATGSVTATLQGANGQSANILNIQTFNGTTATTVAAFDSVGDIFGQQITANNTLQANSYSTSLTALLAVQNAASATVPVAVIRGGATPGAGADLLQLQNSSSATLLRASATGEFGSPDTAVASTNTLGTTLRTGNSTTSGNTGVLTLATGNATSGNSGGIAVDVGTASGTKGSITIGTANAAGVTVGKGTGQTLIVGAASSSSLAFSNGANTSTITVTAPTANRAITFADAGGTVCTTTASTCSSTYINNNTTQQTSASLNIQAGNVANVTAQFQGLANASAATTVIEQATGQTGWLLELQNSSGTRMAGFDSGGNVTSTGIVRSNDRNCASCNSADLTLRSGNGAGTTSNSGNVILDAGTATGSTGAVSIGTANASAITLGRSGIAVSVQGSSASSLVLGNTTVSAAASATATTYQFAAPTAAATYTICTSDTNSCGAASTGYLRKGIANETSSANLTAGQYLYKFSNNGGQASNVLQLDQGTGTGSALSVVAAANPAATNALVYAKLTGAAVSGSLLDLWSGPSGSETSKFSVTAAGAVQTASTINSQTIGATSSLAILSTSGLLSANAGLTVTGAGTFNNGLTVTGALAANGGLAVTGGIANNAGGITGAGAVSGLTSLQYNTNGTLDTASANSIAIGGTNANAITIGRNSGTQPTVSLQGGAGSEFTATGVSGATTLSFAALNASGKIVTVPNETGTICTNATSSVTCTNNYAAAVGSANYIQNQNAGQQLASNFWISGVGRADVSLQAPTFDTATAAALNIGTAGGPTATAINLNQNTTIASGKSLTIQGALTHSGGTFALAGNGPSSISTTAGNTLTITAAAASTWSTSNGALTVQGYSGIGVNTADVAAAASGNVTVTSGNVTSGAFASGNVRVDAGTSTGTTGTITVGGTSASAVALGRTGVTTTTNGTSQVGAAAGTGALVNNGTTKNTALAIANLDYSGSGNSGAIGTAGATVDLYTTFTINETTANQTLTVPTPTVGGAASTGRVMYVANTGSVSFTLLTGGATLNPNSTATLVFNGTTWSFAGADGSSILNQSTNDQSADFRITGTGRANTSFTAPVFDSISGGLSLGTGTATGITLGGANTTGTISVGNGAASTINLGTSANAHTIGIGSDSTTVQGVTIGSTNGASATNINAGSGNLALKSANLIQFQSTAATLATINTSATGATLLSLQGALTSNSGQTSLGISTSFTPTANASVNYIGLDASPTFQGSASNFDNGTLIGVQGNASYTTAGSGRLGTAVGGRFSVTNTTNRTLTSGYGLQVTSFTDTNSKIAAQAGIAIAGLATATADTSLLLLGTTTIPVGDFSIYNSSAQSNVFAGNLRIGSTTAPAVALDVTGAAAVSGNTTLGTAGASIFTNNGATKNTVCAYVGVTGAVTLNTASKTPDVCTTFTLTTSGAATITVPAPAAGAGSIVYISNLSASTNLLTLLGATLNIGATATLVYNGTTWTFAGADASSIVNQNTADQTADFRITGTGRANTSFISPLIDSISGGLSIGTGTATSVTLGSSTSAANALTFEAGSTGTIAIGNAATAHTIAIGSGAAVQGVTLGSLTTTSATTINGGSGNINLNVNQTTAGVTVKTVTNNSATAFQVQNAAGTALFLVDTATAAIRIGDATNNVSFAAGTREPTLNGTARHTKNLTLTAEFAGAVLDADGSSNTGTMTAAFEATQRFGYYKWVTGQGTAQDYDIVTTVPVPDDYAAWTGTPTFFAYGSAGSSMSVTVLDTAGTVATNYNAAALTTSTTWTARSVTTPALTGTYTQGSTMTVRIHLTAAATTGDVRLGTITIPYFTRW